MVVQKRTQDYVPIEIFRDRRQTETDKQERFFGFIYQ